MTVKQLIETLSKVDENLEVMVDTSSVDGDWSQCVHLSTDDLSVDTPSGDFVCGVGTNDEIEEFDDNRKAFLIRTESV